MSYIDDSLGRNEVLHYRARFPTVYRLGAWIILAVFVAAGLAIGLAWEGWIGAVVAGVGILIFVSLMLRVWTTEIGITTQRVIYKRGLLWRTSKELQLRAIEEVSLEQGIFGRLFNYGRVALHGTGVDDIVLPPLAEPVALQRAIQEAIGSMTQVATPSAVAQSDEPIKAG
jgi:uncharacterized membrane protein YdbT with pleckstrin-like domain